MQQHAVGAATAALLGFAAPASAGPELPLGSDVGFTPIVDARLRYEHVDLPALDADALTLRVRAGGQLRAGHFSALAESEATLGLLNDYSAFAFARPNNQYRPGHATIPDPQNIELNRLQLQYQSDAATLTVGRQRISIDDERWISSAGFRQNEQTFDAVRGQFRAGPASVDATYAISQRTIFGIDAGPRQAYDGKFWFLGAGVKAGPVNLKGFAYLLDYDAAIMAASSSKTFGARATARLPLAARTTLDLAASYARQSDYGSNPVAFGADYYAAEAALGFAGLRLKGGWEQLGADANAAGGVGRAVQTPMATAHKFNGWADVFATTPNQGLREFYAGADYRFTQVQAIPGLNAGVSWHQFHSTTGSIDYGREWDANVGFRINRVAILAKYANYDARGFGVDTRKFWLQAAVEY